MTRFFQGIYYDNLGCSYSAGTFTIHGADGRSLSALNPAVVVLPSKASPGLFVEYQIEANQSFIDDAGASQIIGNLFGFTTSVAITVDVPFFIYAVANDNEDTIAFMISRIPGVTNSPSSTNIGVPGTPSTSNNQWEFYSLPSITTTSYDGNPCFCLGSLRMRMSASDDWTVQALESGTVSGQRDGFGQFQNDRNFTIPLGQFSANSGTLTLPNGGTAPVFTNTSGFYWFDIPNAPQMTVRYDMDTDGGTDGAGAVIAKVITPYDFSAGGGTEILYGPNFTIVTPGYSEFASPRNLNGTDNSISFRRASLAYVNWADFTNGSRFIQGNMTGKIKTS